MSMQHPPMSERLLDLVIAHETDVLTEAEAKELAHLMASAPAHEVAEVRRAISVGQAAMMPVDLRGKLQIQAHGYFAGRGERGGSLEGPASLPMRQAASPVSSTWAWSGWMAAAAAIAMAIFVGLRPSTTVTPEQQVAAIEARQDNVKVAFQSQVEKAASVKGEVVWNDALGEGYIAVSGLVKNDPARTQYQLWVVDPTRDAKPVDAGVFDMVDGTLRIPVRTKLPVNKPVAFAITEEKPGGVVQSAGPILALAAR